MNWDSIEVKWSEMARRASGDNGRSDALDRPDKGLLGRKSDAGPAEEAADTTALDAVVPPDRAIA